MFKRTFDFTNETASHPPARKKRLFGGSTLATCDFSFKKKIELPAGENEAV
jgi:hypothetical protein